MSDNKGLLRKLLDSYHRIKVDSAPSQIDELSIKSHKDDLVSQLESSTFGTSSISQLNEFRTISGDRETQYNIFDEMATDSVIAAALELYADDATAYDEQGRIIWVESDDENIAKAGNRLLNILEIPKRAWKHIYQACKYGDYYLMLYRKGEDDGTDVVAQYTGNTVKVINDKVEYKGKESIFPYEEYVEDLYDPATIFDLRKRGKTAGYVRVTKNYNDNTIYSMTNVSRIYTLKDVEVFRPDRIIHIMISENMTRNPETITLRLDDETSTTYDVARGKSILYDVYPVQRELQLLEDALLLNRLTRSALIRLLEIEVGDMPKREANAFLRRIKNLIEQHISMDKNENTYKSYNSPGPIDNVIYIPVRNGKGSVSVNNLGGDVNVRDISDIDYFYNKRAGALKIPRQYLGGEADGGLSAGQSLTQVSIRYARTIKRIQISYIRAITTMLNLFFIDKGLDYVNKFTVRMTSPSTQEDLDRANLVSNNIDLVSSIMSLLESLEGDTQKEILEYLITNIMKMPEISEIISKDTTPEDEIQIDGEMSQPDRSPSINIDIPTTDNTVDATSQFTSDEYSSFEDELPSDTDITTYDGGT